MLPAGSSAVERRPWAEARSALGVGLLEAVDQRGELVRRGCEAERLARAAVELRGDLVEALLADPGEARSLREVLAKQAVGVLVRAPLPGAAGIAEVDLDPRLDREAPLLRHLRALIPGERAAKLGRQRGDALLERLADLDGAAPLGQRDELAVARLALDQGRDRARPSAHQEVALPVAGDRALIDLGRALGDHHHPAELALALTLLTIASGHSALTDLASG